MRCPQGRLVAALFALVFLGDVEVVIERQVPIVPGVSLMNARKARLITGVEVVEARRPARTLERKGGATLFFDNSFTSAQGYTSAWNHCPSGTVRGKCPGGWDINVRAAGTTDTHGNTHGRQGDWYPDSDPAPALGDQISLAANYSGPGAGGGFGFRHYMSPGDDQNGAGLRFAWGIGAQSQIWMRWVQRWLKLDGSGGFKWAHGHPTGSYQKSIYVNQGNRTGFFVVGFHNSSEAWYTHVSTNGRQGNIDSSVDFGDVGDGRWHTLEFRMKSDTNGRNGELEMWADNVRVLLKTNIDYNAQPYTHMVVGSNQAWPAQDGYSDYDDLALSATGRIGPP